MGENERAADGEEGKEMEKRTMFAVCSLSDMKPFHRAIGEIGFELPEGCAWESDTQLEQAFQFCREIDDLTNLRTVKITQTGAQGDADEQILVFLVNVALGSVGDGLKSLDFIRCGPRWDTPMEFLRTVRDRCPVLESLSLGSPFLPSIKAMEYLPFEHCNSNSKKLSFQLQEGDVDILAAIPLMFPNVEEIDIHIRCRRYAGNEIFDFGMLGACENLKILSICSGSLEAPSRVVVPYLPNLEVLTAEFRGILNMSALGPCRKLRKIDIDCFSIHGAFPNFETTRLEYYYVDIGPSISQDVDAVQFRTPLEALEKSANTMKELYLHNVTFPMGWLAQFTALTTLNIFYCQVLADDGTPGSEIAIILDRMPILRELVFNNSHQITHISAMSTHRHMQCVNLIESRDLHDIGGVSKCNKLQDAVITGCPKIDVTAVETPPSVVVMSLRDLSRDKLF